MKKYIILLVICTMVSITEALSQSYVVVVNSSNSVSSISKKELSDVFLKKKTKWESGTTILPVDLVSGSSVRESFSTQVHGKNVAAIRSYWQQAVFSGSGSAPIEKSNDTEIIDYVKKNPGAIGYVSSGAGASGVRQVDVK